MCFRRGRRHTLAYSSPCSEPLRTKMRSHIIHRDLATITVVLVCSFATDMAGTIAAVVDTLPDSLLLPPLTSSVHFSLRATHACRGCCTLVCSCFHRNLRKGRAARPRQS